MPDLHWETQPEAADQVAAVIPTGPADPADSWQLIVAEAANSARRKLWIASPYFVPDEGVLTALQTAAIRGVDVRILIPERADHLLVWLSAFSYYEQSIPYGVKLFRYHRGFLHQKVMLIDERLAAVGTANLDNRSFRLNFEITAFSTDRLFVDEVTRMLTADFHHAREAKRGGFHRQAVSVPGRLPGGAFVRADSVKAPSLSASPRGRDPGAGGRCWRASGGSGRTSCAG